jgi:hypothetical protein
MSSSQNPDRLFGLKLNIVVGVAAVSFALSAALTFAFWSCSKKDDDRNAKTCEFGRDAIGMAAGISAAAYAFQSVRQNAAQQKKSLEQSAEQHEITLRQSADLQHRSHSIDITRDYINLWDEEPFAHARVKVSELIKDLNGTKENRAGKLHDLLKASPDTKQDVTLILNLLEKIAIFRQQELLNEILLRKFYEDIVLQIWEMLKSYATERREQMNGENHSGIYENLEALYKDWSENP